MVPPSGKIVYDYTKPMWIPTAAINPQSQCLKERRKQNRVDILDWTLEIKEVSLLLNLETEEISLLGTKTNMQSSKRRMSNDSLHKSNNCLGTTNTLSTI